MGLGRDFPPQPGIRPQGASAHSYLSSCEHRRDRCERSESRETTAAAVGFHRATIARKGSPIVFFAGPCRVEFRGVGVGHLWTWNCTSAHHYCRGAAPHHGRGLGLTLLGCSGFQNDFAMRELRLDPVKTQGGPIIGQNRQSTMLCAPRWATPPWSKLGGEDSVMTLDRRTCGSDLIGVIPSTL